MLFGCSSATNRLITSKDHASVQLNVGHLDEFGRYTGQFTTYALCGFIRAQVTSLLLLNIMLEEFYVWIVLSQLVFCTFQIALVYEDLNVLLCDVDSKNA